MHDQIAALRSRDIQAISTTEKGAERKVMAGECSLLYTTPESALGRYGFFYSLPQLVRATFQAYLMEILLVFICGRRWKPIWKGLHREVGVKLIAVDEAHCGECHLELAFLHTLPLTWVLLWQ